MKIFLAASLLILSLIGCSKPGVDVEGKPPLAGADDSCVVCGSGCIPKSLQPMALCEPTTEDFECEIVEGACERAK